MGEKAQKVSALSPLISDSIWAYNENITGWKVIGNSSFSRTRSRSIVGDMGLGKAKIGAMPWSEEACISEGRKRSMSTSAIAGLALRLGLEENDEQYRGLCSVLKEGVVKSDRVKVEKGTLSTLRRNSLDPAMFMESIRAEKSPVKKKSFTPPPPKTFSEKLCIVQFGSGARCFGAYKGIVLAKGVFVIIEADRGEDCGAVVVEEAEGRPVQELAAEHAVPCLEVKHIYRVATHQDKLALLEQNELEKEAVASCREKAKTRKLSMEIVDAEYQWDRNKLTFYFRSDKRVDFRDLVKELYKVYKTRIWMCAVEKKGEKRVLCNNEETSEEDLLRPE
ncbi:hypothetical protein NEDG_00832 [Nematocida displodere]|uniref:PSP1 C-terminal domain-containing protein n=1 Tax=Nematocida displodere TaxID=1805483 RepID=A0A177EFD1_9MICR|nr:hypothetical protein NEDG_00832 [Nematocida displodere]